ncbi:Uncharacterised protein [uncultured archaeon]|nr:Uncharacterised protein [uncultured archaeon]
MDQKGQITTEYVLLVMIGLVILVVAVSFVGNMKTIFDSMLQKTNLERSTAITMLGR